MVPDYYWNYVKGAAEATGLGDMSLGFKQQLGPTKGKFDVSLVPSVSFPTGANAISSHGYDPMVQLPWSRGLSKNWTVAGMFSVAWPTQAALNGGTKRNVTGQGSVYFDRQLTSPWDAWVDTPAHFLSGEARRTSSISARRTKFLHISSLIFTPALVFRPRHRTTLSASVTRSASRLSDRIIGSGRSEPRGFRQITSCGKTT